MDRKRGIVFGVVVVMMAWAIGFWVAGVYARADGKCRSIECVAAQARW